MSGGFPRNFQELQRTLASAQQSGRKFGGAGGGSPRGLGGLFGVALLGGGAILISNALFNGRSMLS